MSVVSASIKTNKGTYHTRESVFVLSTVGINDNLCRSQTPPETVKVYIVEHKDSWSDGDDFIDVRDNPIEIPNAKFSNTNIWENPKTGFYDLIVDCNDDQKYDEASEPIYNKGFTIIPKKGSGSMSRGFRSPSDFEWQYDPENPVLSKEFFQLKLVAMDEDIKLEELTLDIKSPLETIDLEIFFDKNNNGIVDSGDESIVKNEQARKEEVIQLDYTIRQDIDENFLFVFNNHEDQTKGEYSIKLLSLKGKGLLSEEEVRFFGNPLESNIMRVVDKKTCIGEITLELNPNPVILNEEVTAKISGLSGCNDKKIILKSNECHVATGNLGDCILEANECEITIDGVKGTYSACIDKDNNTNFNGFGEAVSVNLDLKEEPKTTEESIELSEENNSGTAPVTGNVIGNIGDLEINNSLLIVLEITLILILVFLILIFYRVLKPKTDSSPDEGDDEDKIKDKKSKEEKEDDLYLFDEIKEEIKEHMDEKEEYEEKEEDKKEDDKPKKDSKKKKK